MRRRTVWHGTQDEAGELLQALSHHCTCNVSTAGVRAATCAPHQVLSDQRILDGLLFARRIVARLRAEEHSLVPSDGALASRAA